MRIKHSKLSPQSPAQKFKTEIRRKQRQQIRSCIRNKLNELNDFDACLTKLCINTHKHMHIVSNLKNGNQADLNASINNNSTDYVFDMEDAGKSISHLNYFLNQMNTGQLAQILEMEEEARRNDIRQINCCCQFESKLLKNKLQQLIQMYIPHVRQILDQQIIRSQFISSQQREEVKNEWIYLTYIKEVSIFKNSQIVKQCISILCQLSSVLPLSFSYCQRPNQSPIQLFRQFTKYEAAKIISEELGGVVGCSKQYYQCLIAMGNIIYSRVGLEGSKERAMDDWEYFYQIISDVDLQTALACKFINYNLYYQFKIDSQLPQGQDHINFHQQQNIATVQTDEQDTLVWFTQIYLKFVYSHQKTKLRATLHHQLQMYIINVLNYLVHGKGRNQYQNHAYIDLSERECTIIQRVVTILNYSDISLDNMILISTVIPLLRDNWHVPQVAKFWLYLTFKGDYRISELCAQHMQMHKDKTIKYQAYQNPLDPEQLTCKNKSKYSNTQIRIIDQQNRQIQNKIMSEVIEQIFYAIIEFQQTQLTKKRDINLMQGIFNILLEIQPADAKQIWEQVYKNNQQMQSKLNSLQHLEYILHKIQDCDFIC